MPSSGQPGTEVAISGRHFAPDAQYSVYWDTPEMPIGIVLADGVGQIGLFTDTVPLVASPGMHQVVAELEGTVVAQSPFTVRQQ